MYDLRLTMNGRVKTGICIKGNFDVNKSGRLFDVCLTNTVKLKLASSDGDFDSH